VFRHKTVHLSLAGSHRKMDVHMPTTPGGAQRRLPASAELLNGRGINRQAAVSMRFLCFQNVRKSVRATGGRSGYRWRPVSICILLSWAVLCHPEYLLSARQNGASAQSTTEDDTRQLPTDGRVNLTLKALRAAIRRGPESNLLTSFRQLTTADPSVLVARPGNKWFVPLYRVLAEEFERLPEETQAMFRTTSDRAAQLALSDALQFGHWDEVLHVAHRFPGTESAHLAHLILAQLHLDQGNPLAAAFWLHTLQSSSLSPATKPIEQQLQLRLPRSSATSVPLLSNHRRSDSTASAPWHVRWRRRPWLSSVLQNDVETAQLLASVTTDPAWNADIRGTAIYRRTLRGLTAMDVHSGEINWSLKLRPSHLDQLSLSAHPAPAGGLTNSVVLEQFRRLLTHDGVRNRITTGVDAIYVVTASAATAGVVATRLGQIAVKSDARLVAVSRYDGRRIWSVGGPGLEVETDDQLADVWFAGPPLVDREFLHCVVQSENEIRLITLRARSGEVIHSTVLAFPDHSIELEPARQLVSATPVAAGGLLLCSTTTGWLVAVDTLTRSIVWATHTGSNITEAARALRMTRGRKGVQFSRDQSPATLICLLGQIAAVIPWNSREICFVDLVSGIRHTPLRWQSRPRLLAVVDNGLIIATKEGYIERVDALKSERVWKRVLTPEDGRPCGSGIIRENKLLLAMTTGAIVSMDLLTGEILESTPDVLGPSKHGMLLDLLTSTVGSLGGQIGDVLFIGATDTICLTRESITVTPAETTEMVEHLLAAGRLQSAWDTLTELPAAAFSSDAHTAALRFEVAFQLAVAGKLPANVSMPTLATNRKHSVKATVLQIAQELNDDPLAAATAAIEFLQLERAFGPASVTASIKLPVSLLPKEQPAADEVSVVTPHQQSRISVRTWAAQIIQHALRHAPADARDRFVQRLADLSPETLMQIYDPLVINAIDAWLSESTRQEQAVHLRLHRNAVLHDAAASPFGDLWRQPGPAATSREVSRMQSLRKLLAVAESPQRVDRSPGQVAPGTQLDDLRHDWWDSWNRSDYLTVPIRRPTPSHRQPYRLKLAEPNDSFLRQFDWLIHRTPSRLIVREVAPSGRLIWSVPGFFPGRPGVPSVPTLHRSGHLLLIQCSDSVTAVSLLENRVLWQARGRTDVSKDREFSLRRNSPRLISSGPRWVCLRNEHSIEMLHTLTGQCMWSYPIAPSNNVFAGESCVIVSDEASRTVTALERRSGQRLNHQFSFAEAREIVATTGTDFVIRQRDSSEPGTVRYVWRNVISGDISQTAEFTDVAHIQPYETSQLANFHTDGRLSVIDLRTAAVRQYHWSKQSNSESNRPDNNSKDRQRSHWKPTKIRFFEDSGFIYLIHLAKESQPRIRVPERELTPFRAVIIINRSTGEHLWETSLPESRTGIVVTDQLSLPFLVVLDEAVPGRQGERDARVRLRCFRKRDGSLLIEQFLPSRYSYDELRISAAEDYSVSVQVHGTEVRFERPEAQSVQSRANVPEERPQ